MSVRDEIHTQIVGGLAGAKFPINSENKYDENKTYRKRRRK